MSHSARPALVCLENLIREPIEEHTRERASNEQVYLFSKAQSTKM